MADQNFTYNPSGQPPASDDEQDAAATRQHSEPDKKPSSDQTVTWQASEFIEHSKNASWFVGLIVGAVIIAGLIFIITHNILAVIVIVLSAVAIGQLAHSKPGTNDYALSWHGLTVNGKFYPLSNFKSFSLFQDGAIQALHFESAKRFANPMTLYFSPDDQDKIVNLLRQVMPQDAYKPDSLERAMRRVRF